MDWHSWFAPATSPYFAMYKAGLHGIPIEEVSSYCTSIGVPLREKDVRNWADGCFNRTVRSDGSVLNPTVRTVPRVPALDSTLADYPKLPDGWSGTDKRWFPCDAQNMPKQKWGYAKGFVPQLYDRASAIALSDCGFVGQNMYAQPFVVIDIDGVGHGCTDDETIAFGRRYSCVTETWEDADKPGSFHLYFSCDRMLPIQHWPYAKIDFMGNAKNAAVYTKRKESNGLPRMTLTEEVWKDLRAYVRRRRERSLS